MIKVLRNYLPALLLSFSCFFAKAQHTTFQKGDIFLAAVYTDSIQWRDSNHVFIRNIATPDGAVSGSACCLRFNPVTQQLWITNTFLPPHSPNGIRIINTNGTPGPSIDISAYQGTPTSITFDSHGNAYIGGLWNDGQLVKISPAGNILEHYTISTDGYGYGPEWVELDCNDSIMYYNFLENRIKRFNVATHQQLPDFASFPGVNNWFFAMRLLPDGTMITAAADNRLCRMNASGQIIQNYAPANLCGFFAMAANPDGKSFWAGGHGPGGPMYKFDIASGRVLDSFISTPTMLGVNINGIAVFGDQLKNCPVVVAPDPQTFNKDISIYPNPGNGHFTLQTKLTGQVMLTVLNVLGQPVYQKEFNLSAGNTKIPVSLPSLPAGIYRVQLSGKDGKFVRTVMLL